MSSPIASRRQFLNVSLAGSAALSMGVHGWAVEPASKSTASPNGTVRLAMLGAGGRSGELTNAFLKCRNAKIVMVADPDLGRAEALAKRTDAVAVADLRTAIDDPNVDAVVIATCNHWHCLAAVWAIRAGKDVYVEKPLSHSQWEGRVVVDEAAKAGTIVQLGTQQRSDPMQMQAREFLHVEKALGEIQYVQANRLGVRGPIGRREKPLEIPKGLDYDLWLGPAADQPIYRNTFHYDWHWDWNTGSGEMGNWGVHVLDDVRNVAYQDSVPLPKKITVAGGRVGWNDAGQTPNVHFALFETDTFPTLIALSNLAPTPGKKGTFHAKSGRPMTGPESGYVVVCENGYYLGQRGRGEAVDRDGNSIRKFRVPGNTVLTHTQNFIDAVLSRDASSLNAPIENGHHSTGWCNLANVGFRAAGKLDTAALEATGDLAAWPVLMDEMISQLAPHKAGPADLRGNLVLTHDAKTERFIGENADKANPFLKRDYRAGFELV